MAYYRSNELCKQLAADHDPELFWSPPEGVWDLVYGDDAATPKVLLTAIEEAGHDLLALGSVAAGIAARADLPWLGLEWVKGQLPTLYSRKSPEGLEVEPAQLAGWLGKYGVPLGRAGKYVNDALSSDYHAWQRASLGGVVSDIDLVRLDPATGNAAEIHEIKRSKIPVDRWKPYKDDYPNFRLLTALGALASIPFSIVYYHMPDSGSGPRVGDPSALRLFSFDGSNAHDMVGKTISLPEFVARAPASA